MTFVELYAGLAAVTLHLFGAQPPVSRIGAKTGYAAGIAGAMDLRALQPGDRVVLVESDERVAEVLRALFDSRARSAAAAYVERHASWEPREAWRAAKGDGTPGAWLLWTAGARGGIGGFKGEHARRPSVDGFIPSRDSLARRLREFPAPPCPVEVVYARAQDVEPIPGAKVYLDPPYTGRQGYQKAGQREVEVDPRVIAARWTSAGCLVALSESHPLPLAGARHVDLTRARRGQRRRSLTRDTGEWLTILG